MDSYSQRLSGRLAMQRVFDVIRKDLDKAKSSLSFTIGAIVATILLTLFGWLWGKPATLTFCLFLIAFALAYGLHAMHVRDIVASIERRAIREAEESGFSVRREERELKHSLRVTASAEDWIRSKLLAQFYPDLVGLTPTGDSRDELSSTATEPQSEVFAWSPGSTVAAIQMGTKPDGRLSRATYRTALADRINQLVAEAGEEEARNLLKTVERYDPAVNTNDLGQLGQAMLDASNWLNERIHFPIEGVPAEELEHDPELEAFFESDDNLEGYLNEVYPIRESGME